MGLLCSLLGHKYKPNETIKETGVGNLHVVTLECHRCNFVQLVKIDFKVDPHQSIKRELSEINLRNYAKEYFDHMSERRDL